ncbi:E3 ubiquitin-protein ligase TRIM33-like [Ruditapes philippinarum]|uniref:E3 ubiquitin-protein ligase TRIM33-like n=1 Tax=Ruditapes philippinarum TaxID=129788 RepID=UPI00295B0905|nr:E3 ubiquitin-protein ligase TRIM33-like [Ruditapes philippinarum]
MEVPGQKVTKDKNAKLCSLCEDYDITSNADGFCLECEVNICNSCFVKHKGRKSNRNHSLVSVDDSSSVKVTVGDTYETCQEHNGEFVKIYCSKHDQVGCAECILVYHNGCKLEHIRDKAAAYENSQEFENLRKEMNKCMKEAEDSLSLIESNRKQLTEFYEQFVSDVEAFTDHVIERINKMKKKVLNQAKDIMLNDKRKMEDLQKDIDDLIAELTRQNIELESKSDTPNNLFVATLLMKPELKKIKQNCDSFRHKNIVTQYKFMQDKILAQSITENKVIGMLIEQSFERSEHHQDEFKQAYSADEGQVQDPLPQQAQSESRNKQIGNILFYLILRRVILIAKEVAETCTIEDAIKAIAQKKLQPLLDRKLVCKNLTIDGECLSYAAYESNDVGLYVFKENVHIGTFFEIEIISMGKRGSIAIGVVPDNYSDNLLLGVGNNSCGYHSDGNVRKNGSVCDIKHRQSWQVGDKIRCKIG